MDATRPGVTVPDVTVLVPTYRRPEGLRRLLAAVADEDAPFTWEVVIVDNDSAASARAVVAELTPRFSVPLRYVVEDVTGAVHARNRGIREAAGRVLAMLDDDVVPQRGWLAEVCAPVLAGTAVGAGGTVMLDPGVPRPAWLDEEGLGGYLTAHSLGPEPRALSADEIVVTANAAFDRTAVESVGGFDPTYGPRGRVQIVADDAYLVRQLMRAGGVIQWVPDAVVVHDLPPQRLTRRYLMKRAYWQGRSDWMLWSTDHQARRFGGARVAGVLAGGWLKKEWRKRRAEGLTHPPVAFHAACDLARFAGTVVQVSRGLSAARRA